MYYNEYFKNKTILVTGHTGFKGSWLAYMLKYLGAEVVGYSLDPVNEYDNFNVLGLKKSLVDIRGDVRDFGKLRSVFEQYKPDVVFHLAAQPLVRDSYSIPRETIEINLMGTVNVMEAFRNSSIESSLVVITSDKVYENREWVWSYRENDRLGGYDPYSASKGATELLCSAYQRSFFSPDNYDEHHKVIATVRAGNVIGGGDWSRDRIIPDVIRAIDEKRAVKIRNPDAVRPWQHVVEPLHGYLLLASKMETDPLKFSGAWNFGPNSNFHLKVRELVKILAESYGDLQMNVDDNNNHLHESKMLSLDNTKSAIQLGWHPMLSIEETIDMTVEWYKNYKNKQIMEIIRKQVENYLAK